MKYPDEWQGFHPRKFARGEGRQGAGDSQFFSQPGLY